MKLPAFAFNDGALAVGALWGLMAASTALNAWGWAHAAPWLIGAVLVALVVASEILGMSLADRLATLFAAGPSLRSFSGVALFAGVVAFNGYSGHRALEAVEEQRREPYERAMAAHDQATDEVTQLTAQLVDARYSLSAIPANIPGSRIEILQAPHRETIARLEPRLQAAESRLTAAPAPGDPPAPIGGGVMWAIVVLIEALKALGLWTIRSNANAPAATAQTAADQVANGKELFARLLAAGAITRSDAASILARARWNPSPAA